MQSKTLSVLKSFDFHYKRRARDVEESANLSSKKGRPKILQQEGKANSSGKTVHEEAMQQKKLRLLKFFPFIAIA